MLILPMACILLLVWGAGAALWLRHLTKALTKTDEGPAAASERERLSPADEAAVAASVAHAVVNGLLMRAEAASPPSWVHCPFALRPTPFPRPEFLRALRLAPLYGRLVHRIASDPDWLHAALQPAADADEFTANLLRISRAVRVEGEAQPICLGLLRADYMLHTPGLERGGGGGGGGGDGDSHSLLQVELNTIAASFGCLSALVTRMHAALAPPPDGEPAAAVADSGCAGSSNAPSDSAAHVPQQRPAPAPSLPHNPALRALPEALLAAHDLYCEQAAHKAPASAPVVLFVVREDERNCADQHLLALGLEQRTCGRVRVVRRTLRQLAQNAHLGPAPSCALLLPAPPELYQRGTAVADAGSDDAAKCCGSASTAREHGGADMDAEAESEEAEVSVVCFRAGYSPADYACEACWSARLLLERSGAVKCPSIRYHLAGAKKVQQALAGAGAVERFLPSAEAAAVRASFAALWPLDELDAELPPGLPPGLADAAAMPGATSCAPPAAADAAASSPAADAADDMPQPRSPQSAAQPLRARTLRELVVLKPSEFVLKPQREGGGNNVFGAAIPPKLASLRPGEEKAYTLMERIRPPIHRGRVLVRAEAPSRADTLSELGVFTAILSGPDGCEVVNEYAGHILRTKPVEADEGGVAAGFAVLDSPLLC